MIKLSIGVKSAFNKEVKVMARPKTDVFDNKIAELHANGMKPHEIFGEIFLFVMVNELPSEVLVSLSTITRRCNQLKKRVNHEQYA